MSPLYPLAILGRLVTPSAAYWMLMPGQCVSEAEGVVEVGVGVRMGVGVEVGVGVGVMLLYYYFMKEVTPSAEAGINGEP